MTARRKRKDTAPPIGDHLLTLCEAAEVLRLSTRTVRKYILRGEIEGRIIGGRWKFRRADLDAFFANARRNWDFAGKNDHAIPGLLLVMLILWLIVLFLSFGIFAPRNLMVIVGLFMAAVAVCGAILLILEMYHPQTGLIRISDAPLRAALAELGQ
jgi:excisionase family DNA binding protein